MSATILRFIGRTRFIAGVHCHRCHSVLMGRIGSRYCMNCQWDELDDPTKQMSGCETYKSMRALKNAA